MVNHNQEIKALLEKLASGSINESEMQTLEHLAQEDPFLRDAIEGYEMSGDQIENSAIASEDSRETWLVSRRLTPFSRSRTARSPVSQSTKDRNLPSGETAPENQL